MNNQRDELLSRLKSEDDPLAKARIIKYLHLHEEITTIELANRLHVSQPYISSLMRLLKLPDMVVDGYQSGQITRTHLMIMSRLDNKKDMKKVYEKILLENMTTFQTEEVVRKIKYSLDTKKSNISKSTVDNIKEIFKKINSEYKVKILQTRIRSKITAELIGDMETTSKAIRGFEEILQKGRKE